MKTFAFYVWDDSELYHWDADSKEQAVAEICEDWDIEPDQIEYIGLEEEAAQ